MGYGVTVGEALMGTATLTHGQGSIMGNRETCTALLSDPFLALLWGPVTFRVNCRLLSFWLSMILFIRRLFSMSAWCPHKFRYLNIRKENI